MSDIYTAARRLLDDFDLCPHNKGWDWPRVIADLRSAAAHNGWRPMESAPERLPILVHTEMAVYRAEIHHDKAFIGGGSYIGMSYLRGWQPLPKLPPPPEAQP